MCSVRPELCLLGGWHLIVIERHIRMSDDGAGSEAERQRYGQLEAASRLAPCIQAQRRLDLHAENFELERQLELAVRPFLDAGLRAYIDVRLGADFDGNLRVFEVPCDLFQLQRDD